MGYIDVNMLLMNWSALIFVYQSMVIVMYLSMLMKSIYHAFVIPATLRRHAYTCCYKRREWCCRDAKGVDAAWGRAEGVPYPLYSCIFFFEV